MIPASPDAYKLMMDGAHAFADAEQNGMRVDVAYLDKMIEETGSKIRDMERQLKEDEVYREWRKVYGEKSDLNSRTQLGRVIFDHMGVKCKHRTKNNNPKTDEDSLEEVDFPFVKKWNDVQKLKRLRATNLVGIKREVVDGFLHPFFHLHLARTYRPSSSDPNFQSLPNRDRRQAKIVRRMFIPRGKDYLFSEADFSRIEVCAATCYHQDPNMIKYIEEDHDLHKEMAAECFMLDEDEVSKPIRQVGKNGFVFPSFYGDWYLSICQAMWRAVDREKLKTVSGKSLRQHLTEQGINGLGDLNPKEEPKKQSFEAHIKKVERSFWNERFPTYTQWKEDFWKAYLENGFYQMLTGFVCKGIYKKNEVINGGIQGVAFHWLLWTVIQLNDWLKRNRMRSKIIGNIHDSIEMDVHKDEKDDVIAKLKHIIEVEIREFWKWIIVPLEIEFEASDISWYDKVEIPI